MASWLRINYASEKGALRKVEKGGAGEASEKGEGSKNFVCARPQTA